MTPGCGDRAGTSLNHIGFGAKAVGVRLGAIHVFEQEGRAVVRALLQLDATAGSHLGFLVFPQRGIALTGLHDNDAAQRALTLFPPGAWDKRIARLTPMRP